MHDLSENELKERVVRENLDYLVRFALFRIGNMSLAEDAVYDAIVKFIEHKHPPIAPEIVRSLSVSYCLQSSLSGKMPRGL